MTKSILVIDTPKSCGECICFERVRFDGNEWETGCYKLQKKVYEEDKPSDCPLRQVPDKPVFAAIANNEVIFIEPPTIDEIIGESDE